MKVSKISAACFCSMLLLVMAVAAQAATIRVRCEQRANRSKVSVDAKDLIPGMYQAMIISGSNEATSDLQGSVGDEVQVDFASNPNDINQGATPIGANFIQGGQVTGKILNANGDTVISDTVACRVR